jgi:hypothetical protein
VLAAIAAEHRSPCATGVDTGDDDNGDDTSDA